MIAPSSSSISTTSSNDYQPILSYQMTQGQKYRISSLATDATGQKIALGSERNLYILLLTQDGGDTEEQITLRKTLYPTKDSSSTGNVVLSWCHDKLKSNLISTSNGTNLFVYDTNEEKYVYSFNKAHSRHISSLSWNMADSNILASASGDSFIKIWDLRDQKNASTLINAQSSLNQIEWNPHSSTMIASSHCGEIKIWDIRKFGSPLTSFTAHIGGIPSIEWHHKDKSTILTCGTDRSIKIWDASPPSKLLRSYKIGSPCSLSKFVPFTSQKVVATIQQKGDNEISFWSGSNDSSVMNLVGHQSPVLSFDWRIVDGATPSDPTDRKYYLVSLGKDNFIKMWKFTDEMIGNIVNVDSLLSPESKSIGIGGKRNYPLDLSQELLRIVQEKFSNLTIEKTNMTERICVVNIDNRKIILIISFPSLYPSAAPSFEILIKSSPTTNNIKVQLKKELDRLSLEFIETKKPFLYQLLKKFSEFYSQEIEKEPTCYQNITDFVDSPQISKRTSLTMQPFRLSDYQRQYPSPTDSNNNNNTTQPNTLTSTTSTTTTTIIPPTSPVVLTSIGEYTNGNNSFDHERDLDGEQLRSRSNSATPILQSQQDTSSSGYRHRAGSIGSSFAPLPPNAPYYNSNQSVLFEMYEVKPTDTLTGIALQFNMPRNVIIQTNRLLSDMVIPGQILWVFKKKDRFQQQQQQQGQDLEKIPLDLNNLSINGDLNTSVSSEDSISLTPLASPLIVPTIAILSPQQQSQQQSPFTGNRPRSRSSNSSNININDLFKPVKEEVQMAFQTLDPNFIASSGNGKMDGTIPTIHVEQALTSRGSALITKSTSQNSFDTASDKYSWGSHRTRFTQIPKESIHKEQLICFTKNKRIYGTLTLTPYQFIFQSHYNTDQIFADYIQIISCKYFPNKTEWIAHLSRDWNKEQSLIKKKNQDNHEYDVFIQSEISKLNELEEENTISINGKDKKVLVFPCIYLLIYKDKYIQTLFLRGIDENSVQKSFSFLKKLIVDRKESSPMAVSPVLGSTPINNTATTIPLVKLPPPIPIALPPTLASLGGGSFEEHSYSPKLIQTFTKYEKPLEDALLTSEIFKRLRHYLPIRLQGNDVELKYNSTNDGVSFQTFFRKMKGIKFSILLVKDNGGHVFGAFLSDEIRTKDAKFYGDGETFLFKIYPEFNVWKWSKENDFFIYSTFEYFVVGGGSSFGLWMDTDFLHGSSGVCETFKNQCLSYASDFNPIVVECWSVGA
ncbi:WD-40 repeat-containing protein [Cavenderia fasciculata]|uniref:WD-40 repeat-containing protein n=1 Tax=Cavenderia fasciculata TaxID=261658 RepID=F4PSZ6_CACFS|nr:WD-40 repeat-containing protein [Cavenderia fasciculata]EGG20785.1 WD-40 repeat-containing protein [Cavenderia fasciculata]|eukprot:XP_004358635.1 WD-40 repeat-containing protein [Cavenderia fasciculata]